MKSIKKKNIGWGVCSVLKIIKKRTNTKPLIRLVLYCTVVFFKEPYFYCGSCQDIQNIYTILNTKVSLTFFSRYFVSSCYLFIYFYLSNYFIQ